MGKISFVFVALLIILIAFSFSVSAVDIADKKKYEATFDEQYKKIDPGILSDQESVIIEFSRNDFPKITSKIKRFGLGNFYFAKLSRDEILELEKDGSVKRVRLESKYRPVLDVAVPLISVNKFWNNSYNGSGIKICVIDTGINKTHPALASRIVDEKDFVTSDSDGNNTFDFFGHGTHVAGIVASNNNTFRGIAFGADILNAKVFNSSDGLATDTAIMDGIDWCMSNNADILTLSLGGEDNANDGSDILSSYLDLAVDRNKIVTVAAGNSGPGGGNSCRTSDSSGSSYSICTPGLSHKAITVGSTQSGKSSIRDAISAFSSRGPTKDGRIKPDVTAPGQPITSASASGGWVVLSGTSMATPMVAGLSALILQSKNITPAEVKALLMNTAVDLGAVGKDNISGAGRVNASKIFDHINNTIMAPIGQNYAVHNIFVPANGTIKATLYWPENYAAHNDLDFYLLDPSGNTRAFSASTYNTDEIVNFSDTYPGNWKLLVNPFFVNGNQLYAIASNIKPSQQMQLVLGNISNSNLYHKINVTDSVSVNLDWNGTFDLDLYLYNATGHLIASGSSGNNYENVSSSGSGEWLVEILPKQTAALKYTLTSTAQVLGGFEDMTAPNITIIEPVNKTYAANNLTLNFVVEDNLNIHVNCFSLLNNETIDIGFVQNSYLSQSSFSDGLNSYLVSCTDSANNTASASVTFLIDTTPPNITFVPPTHPDNSFVAANSEFINVSADGDIDSCRLEWNNINESMTKQGNVCFANKTDAEGTYLYRIYVNDTGGNAASASRIITFDTTKPVINSVKPLNNTFVKNLTEIFEINYTEINLLSANLHIKNTNMTIQLNCPSGQNKLCSSSINLSQLDNSSVEFIFTLVDKANNTVSSANRITTDRTQPSIFLASPLNTSYVNSNISLKFSASEDAGCFYRLNNTNVIITGNTTLLATNGLNKLELFCSDLAGNAGYAAVNFSLVSLPSASVTFSGGNDNIFSPNDDRIFDAITINITASRVVDFGTMHILSSNGSRVKTFNAVKNVTSVSKEWNGCFIQNCSTGFVRDGSYKIEIKINDTFDGANSTNLTREIIVDTTKPDITFIPPTPGNLSIVSGSVTINVTINESATATLEWDGLNESMNYGGSWSKVKPIQEIVYAFKVYATDLAGNTNVSETRMIMANATIIFENFIQKMAAKNITLKILNSTRGMTDLSRLNSSENYTLRFDFNDTLIEAEFLLNQFRAGDMNITNNIPLINITNAFSLAGGALDSLVWIDFALLDNYTAKIIFPRAYPIYFYLNGSSSAPTATRISNVCNFNASNVPCYRLGNITIIYLPSFSGAAVGNDTQKPSFAVSSPQDITYSSSSISLAYSVSDNVAVDKCWYVLNSVLNNLDNCINTTITAVQGFNTLVLSANDTSGNINSTGINFTFTAPPSAGENAPSGGGGTTITAAVTSTVNRTNVTTLGSSATLNSTSTSNNKITTAECTENWLCNDWSDCTNGTYTRTCSDTNNCGTANKPEESRECAVSEQSLPASGSVAGFATLNANNIGFILAGAIVVMILAYFIRAHEKRKKQKLKRKKQKDHKKARRINVRKLKVRTRR